MKISDSLQVATQLAHADISTARTSAYVSVAGASRILAALVIAAIADTKAVTVQLKQATDSSGTGAKVLGSAVVYTASGAKTNVSVIAEAQVDTLDLANGFGFVAVTISSNDAASAAGVTVFKGGNRFNP